MVREQWKNLNGLWNMPSPKQVRPSPQLSTGKILCRCRGIEPFGRTENVGEENELWYKQTVTIPSEWKNKKICSFGRGRLAVGTLDKRHKSGLHQGGYSPFYFDITPYLNKTGVQKTGAESGDPSDSGYQPAATGQNPHESGTHPLRHLADRLDGAG